MGTPSTTSATSAEWSEVKPRITASLANPGPWPCSCTSSPVDCHRNAPGAVRVLGPAIARFHPGRGHLPGRAITAHPPALFGRYVHTVSELAKDQSFPVHVLHRHGRTFHHRVV